MKLIIKLLLFVIVPIVLGVYMMSCQSGVATGDTSTKFEIILTGSGTFCDVFFDDLHNMTLTVTVDKIVDINTGQTELHDTEILTVDNDLFGKTFNLNIPESGGFGINVQLNSTSCIRCCTYECFSSEGRPYCEIFKLLQETRVVL